MEQRIDVQRAVLDTTRFPVVVLTEHGILSDKERVRVMEGLDELVERRGRHAVVLDLTHGTLLPQSQRTYVTEAFRMREELFAEKWAGLAVVVQKPVLQHMTVAAFWLKVCPAPARMFPALEEAITWARGVATVSTTGAIPILAAPPSRARPSR